MNVAELFARHLPQLLLWGLVATVAMTTILQGSQGLGLSRLSILDVARDAVYGK